MEKTVHVCGLLAVIALTTAGCGADEIFRRVTLTGEATLPQGHSAIQGSTLDVHFDAVEMLAPSHAFVIWLWTAAATTPVHETTSAGEVEIDLAAAGIAATDIRGIFISEEVAGTAVDNVVLGPVFLAGVPNEPLQFGSLTADDYANLSGTVELTNKDLSVMAAALPALPTGYHYRAWLSFPMHDEDGHGHTHGGDEDGEMVDMGEAHGGMLEARGDRMLAEATHVRISIESPNGAASMGHHTVMHGEVTTEAQPGAGVQEQDDGHGDHMH